MDMQNCRNFAALKTFDLERFLESKGFTVMSCTQFVFGKSANLSDQLAYTQSAILSESHAAIHTFPEFKSITFDIFICNKEKNCQRAMSAAYELIKVFDPELVNSSQRDRNYGNIVPK